MKVLIVDDEARYRDYLGATLSGRGHDIQTAETGRTAIDRGLRFHPSVLIADWLLKSNIHGLEVSSALRAVLPDLQTILITGFPSENLQEEAQEAGVFKFIRKPFELDELVRAVEEARAVKNARRPETRLAIVETDREGSIVATNDGARMLFATTSAGGKATGLAELFEHRTLSRLSESGQRWIQVRPVAPEPVEWLARSRKWLDGRLFVFLAKDEENLSRSPLVELVLGIRRPTRVSWPFQDHVLAIDDSRLLLRIYVEEMRRIGCTCYQAETPDLALGLLKAEPRIGVVILDFSMPGVELGPLVRGLVEIRPGIKIVGNSIEDHEADFQALGVGRFLRKPWAYGDLINLLHQ